MTRRRSLSAGTPRSRRLQARTHEECRSGDLHVDEAGRALVARVDLDRETAIAGAEDEIRVLAPHDGGAPVGDRAVDVVDIGLHVLHARLRRPARREIETSLE